MEERVAVIVLAAGQGLRAGTKKQWMALGDRPLLSFSLEIFENHPLIHALYLGVDKDHLEEGKACLEKWAPNKGKKAFAGGERRQDTVYNGLKELEEDTLLVGIHDAARPLASQDLISRVLKKAREKGAAVPAIPLRDTIKEVQWDTVKTTLDRTRLRAIQTPQFFRKEIIQQAYQLARQKGEEATDDASLVEAMGVEVYTVEGEEENFKITYPQDFKRLEDFMGWETRIGFGYDVHPLVPGRPLILGGVEIPHPVGLQGHSDADVLCHAVVDALLGAAGMGDIGELFPDSDPRHKNRPSLEFLEEAAQLIAHQGCQIVHVDATLVLEKPKIAPYKGKMVEEMAKALGISPRRINLKATTTEGLGFTGKGKGVAAYATATLKGRPL